MIWVPDLSSYDTVLNFTLAKACQVELVYLRLGGGAGHKDTSFDLFLKGFGEVGIKRGFYFYVGSLGVQAELDNLKKIYPGRLELTPGIDFEVTTGDMKQDMEKCYALLSWLADKEGRPPLFYTNIDHLKRYKLYGLNRLTFARLWLAYYSATFPNYTAPWSGWTMWQYTDRWITVWTKSTCDMSYAFRTEDLEG
jgi:GH25 family lysozyme M1 (1,4-beta-N-acetylmuramidase)